jgi:integral membrane protein
LDAHDDQRHDRTGETVLFPSKSATIRLFRVLALAEAFSWAALLTGMYFKWVARTSELGVEIAGPVHGAFFITYGVAALAVWRLQRWPFRVAFLAGLSAVFPFATVLFERWARTRGFLALAGSTEDLPTTRNETSGSFTGARTDATPGLQEDTRV